MDGDRAPEIAATFDRIRRPLQWPMADFRRRRLSNRSFVGYRFFRNQKDSVAGFAFGFALRPDELPGVDDPPEVLAYAFAEPTGSTLHRSLTRPPRGPVRLLVASSRRMGYPFEFHPDQPIVAVRHRSMRSVPNEIFPLVAADFLMLCYRPIRASGYLQRIVKTTTKPK